MIRTSSTSPLRKRSRANAGNRSGFGKGRRIAVSEFRGQLAPRAGDELRRLAAGRDEDRRLRIELRRQAEHIRIERPAQPLVGGDQDDGAPPHLRDLEQRMRELVQPGGRAALDAIQQLGKRPCRERGLLGLAHLRCGHHLHGLGNLRGAADRLDAPAKIAGAVHVASVRPVSSLFRRSILPLATGTELDFFHVCLN